MTLIPVSCRVCTTMPPMQVAELDTLMGDPRRWNLDTAYGAMLPARLTPASRKLGAVNVGVEWVREQGYVEIAKRDVLRHYVNHTPIVASTLEEYAAFALAGDPRSPRNTRPTGILAVGEVYNRGIDLANMSLQLLQARMEDRMRRGEHVESAELMAYAEYGAKLAASAAGLKRQGASPFGKESEINAGFRGGEGAPGPRIAHTRLRVVDGESRPVIDEGPKDRAEYNARALAEGREGLT